MKIEVVKAEKVHVEQMQGLLRFDDERECQAMAGRSADESLQLGYEASDFCWTGLLNDKPIAMFGVKSYSLLALKGVPWMLGMEDIMKVRTFVALKSKQYVALMRNRYRYLENWVDIRNKKSIEWLKWCGFNFDKPEEFGYEKELFARFWMEGVK